MDPLLANEILAAAQRHGTTVRILHSQAPIPLPTAEPARPAPCRSRSRYGQCGLSEHPGDHAVPIGDGVWFGYTRGNGKPIGYCLARDGQVSMLTAPEDAARARRREIERLRARRASDRHLYAGPDTQWAL